MNEKSVPHSQLQMGVKHGRWISKYKTYTKKFKKVKIFLVTNLKTHNKNFENKKFLLSLSHDSI